MTSLSELKLRYLMGNFTIYVPHGNPPVDVSTFTTTELSFLAPQPWLEQVSQEEEFGSLGKIKIQSEVDSNPVRHSLATLVKSMFGTEFFLLLKSKFSHLLVLKIWKATTLLTVILRWEEMYPHFSHRVANDHWPWGMMFLNFTTEEILHVEEVTQFLFWVMTLCLWRRGSLAIFQFIDW